MTDRPILFSGPMVRGLLAGRKTQTRRIIKPQPFASGYYDGEIELNVIPENDQWPKAFRFNADAVGGGAVLEEIFEPRINAGDRLWVREGFRGSKGYDAYPPSTWSHWPVHYEADGAPDPRDELEMNGRLRPGIHMPRWASRLTLVATDVRVERLQNISEEDAKAEGIEQDSDGWRDYLMPHTQCCGNPIDSYRTLWDHINGAGAWDANPWVAAYTFKAIKQNIDQIEKVAA